MRGNNISRYHFSSKYDKNGQHIQQGQQNLNNSQCQPCIQPYQPVYNQQNDPVPCPKINVCMESPKDSNYLNYSNCTNYGNQSFACPKPNQVLITDSDNIIKWIDQCNFAGLNTFEKGTMSTCGSIVVKKIKNHGMKQLSCDPCDPCDPNNTCNSECLETLKPTNCNQVLVTNSLGHISWQNQCNFAGLDTQVTSLNVDNPKSGIVLNNGYNNQCDCLTTLVSIGPNELLVTDTNNNITWMCQTGLPYISFIATTDGITGGPITSTGTLGLDGWEIVNGSKILRPKTGIVGKLGDNSHIIYEGNLITLNLYNGSNVHSIMTNAASSYTWKTPSSNPSSQTILSVDTSGNLIYFQPSNPSQVLVSTTGNSILWINQCDFAGLSTTLISLNANAPGSGVVINRGTPNDCLRTLISPGPNQVFITDNGNNIVWISQASFFANVVTSITTSDGILVSPPLGTGPDKGNVTLSLDGWEIVSGNKALRPKTTLVGLLGDSSHVINQEYLNILSINNGGNFQNITTSAIANYNWNLPTNNPSVLSILSVDTSGNLNYLQPTSPTQVLVSISGNIPFWIEQCTFAGLNNTVLSINGNIVGSGVVVNKGTSSDCLRTLTSTIPNQVLVTDNTNNIIWESQSNFFANIVTSVSTSNGLLVSSGGPPTLGPSVGNLTLSLDGWEIIPLSKAFRPKITTFGTLGDTTRIINQAYLNILSLNNGGFFHNITTKATSNYNWSTPTGNPSVLSITSVDTLGNINYLQPTSSTQVLVSISGNVPNWIEQCTFAGLNTTTSFLNATIIGSGIVLNTGSTSNCLETLTSPGINQVLITDNSNNIKWVSQSTLLSNAVTSITTSNGILISPPLGTGPANGNVTLSLDGWEIITINKSLRPKLTAFGLLGDSTHIVNQVYLNMLEINNSGAFHEIVTRANGNYTWSTPTGNPTVTSLLTCDTTGLIGYFQPLNNSQVLVSTLGNAPLWENQCDFAGLSTTVSSLSAIPLKSGVVLNRGTASDCLRTLTSPGANQYLVTDNSNNITWLPQSSIIGSGGTVTSILTVDGITGGPITTTGTLGLDSWQIDPLLKSFRPKTSAIGTIGDTTHIVDQGYFNTLNLNNGGSFHSIITRASGNYTWSTPPGNPSMISLLICDNSGLLGYFQPSNSNQVLVSTGGNTPLWENECDFSGLSTTVSLLSASPIKSGVVLNTGSTANCLRTLTSPGASQVLVTDGANNITWVPQSSIVGSGGTVTQINTTDGITGGPITTTGTLGLDGWEIVTVAGNKIFRPKNPGSFPGVIGDTTHVVAQEYLNILSLNNSNIFHNIISGATPSNYTWTTPSSNPGSGTVLITCNSSGILNYTSGSLANQVFVTSGINIFTWINQCDFAGLSTTVSTLNANPITSGVVLNNGSSSNCLRTLGSPGAGQVLIIDGTNNITWEPRSNFGSSSGISSVTSNDGITSSVLAGLLTLGLNGWEIFSSGSNRIWRPKNTGLNPGFIGDTSHVITQGYFTTLGDSISNPINQEYVTTLSLYKSSGVIHNITTNAIATYNWITPTANPTVATRLVTCDTIGNLNYTSLSAANQVLITDGTNAFTWVLQCDFAGMTSGTTVTGTAPSGASLILHRNTASDCLRRFTPSGPAEVLITDVSSGVMTWISQCNFAGLNTTVSSLNVATAGSGVVLNNGSMTNCLSTMISPGPSQVLTIDGTNHLVWEPRTNFSSGGGGVSQVSTTDGITGGPINSGNPSGTLGLDGWEIVTSGSTKIWRPKNTGLNPGQIGDASHIVNQGFYNTLILNNGGFFHSITTSATGNYSWVTPTSNPITATRLITCDTSGNLSYTSLSTANQVLITDNTNTITWISQCDFAGMTSGSTVTGTAPSGASIVIHRNTASDCLRRFTPGGAELVLVTTSPNVMQWIPQCDFAGLNNVVTVASLGASPLSFGTIINNSNPSQCLMTIAPSVTSGDFQVFSTIRTSPSNYDLKWSNFCDIFPYIGSPFVTNSISGDQYITTASAPSVIVAVDLANPPGSGAGTAPCIYKFQRPTAGSGCGYYFGTDTSNNMGWFEQGTIGGLGIASHEIDITVTSIFNQNNEIVLYNTITSCLYRAFKPADTVLISDTNNQVRWVNQCDFAGMNNVQTPSATATGGVIVRLDATTTNCLETVHPSATNQILMNNPSNIISWVEPSQLSIVRNLSVAPDGVVLDQVVSIISTTNQVVNGFGNEAEEVISEGYELESGSLTNCLNNNVDPRLQDYVILCKDTLLGDWHLILFYYGNGMDRSVIIGNDHRFCDAGTYNLCASPPYIREPIFPPNTPPFSNDVYNISPLTNVKMFPSGPGITIVVAAGQFEYQPPSILAGTTAWRVIFWPCEAISFAHQIAQTVTYNFDFSYIGGGESLPPHFAGIVTNGVNNYMLVASHYKLSNNILLARYIVDDTGLFISNEIQIGSQPIPASSYISPISGNIRNITTSVDGLMLMVVNTGINPNVLLSVGFNLITQVFTVGTTSPIPFAHSSFTYTDPSLEPNYVLKPLPGSSGSIRYFILLSTDRLTHFTYFSLISVDINTLVISNNGSNIFYYINTPTVPFYKAFGNKIFDSNLIIKNVNGPNWHFILTYKDYIQQGQHKAVYGLYSGGTLINWGSEFVIKHTDSLFGKINTRALTAPCFAGDNDMVFIISNQISSPGNQDSISVVATNFTGNNAPYTINKYVHRGENPFGISHATTNTGTVNISVFGKHTLSSIPSNLALTYFAHGNGVLSKDERIPDNLLFTPFIVKSVYKPVPKFARLLDGFGNLFIS